MNRNEISMIAGKIEAGSIVAGKIADFDLDRLGPVARAHWDQLGRRIRVMNEFDATHPVLRRFTGWPFIGFWYSMRRRDYILRKEPTVSP